MPILFWGEIDYPISIRREVKEKLSLLKMGIGGGGNENREQ
jgi:hypothetical protein